MAGNTSAPPAWQAVIEHYGSQSSALASPGIQQPFKEQPEMIIWPTAAQAATQQTSQEQAVQIGKGQQEANGISVGWIIFALILAGLVAFFGVKRLMKRSAVPHEEIAEGPHFGENDRKLLDLAKGIGL